MKRRLVNIDLDLDREIEATAEEHVEQAIEAQRVRKHTFERLRAEKLPIPQDLIDDFMPRPVQMADQTQGQDAPVRDPQLGLDAQDTTALAPTPDATAVPPGAPLGMPAGPGGTVDMGPDTGPGTQGPDQEPGANVINLPRNRMMPPPPSRGGARPPESDEQRKRMPKASLEQHIPDAPILKNALDEPIYRPETGEDGEPLPYVAKEGGIVQGPRHVGLRRWAGLTADTPIGDEPEQEANDG